MYQKQYLLISFHNKFNVNALVIKRLNNGKAINIEAIEND